MLHETSFQPIEAFVHRPSETPHVLIYIVLNTHLDDTDNKQDTEEKEHEERYDSFSTSIISRSLFLYSP